MLGMGGRDEGWGRDGGGGGCRIWGGKLSGGRGVEAQGGKVVEAARER